MYLVAVGWMYVVLLMTVAEATGSNGSLLGAFFTFVLYGVLPLSIVMYLLRAPARRRARRAAEPVAAVPAEAPASAVDLAAGLDPDRRGHPPGDAVAPVREEP